MYKIKLIYNTGDSFHSQDGVEEFLKRSYTDGDFTWKNEEKAIIALRDIKSHYEYVRVMEKWCCSSKEEKQEAVKRAKLTKWAYYDSIPSRGKKNKNNFSEIPSTNNLRIEDDSGNRIDVHCFWTGYFDTLVGGDIVNESESFRF